MAIEWQINDIQKLTKWRCELLLKKVVMAAVAGLVYHIWRCRNICRMENMVQHPTCVVDSVKANIKVRLMRMDFCRNVNMNTHWLRVIGVFERE